MKQHSTPALILGSSSIYRQRLLERLGLPFKTQSPDIDETPLTDESPVHYVQRLAFEKARAISKRLETPHPHSIIIGSDQTLVLNQEILGKPLQRSKARQMLTACSGQSVWFHCSWCLLDTTHGVVAEGVHPTEVVFRQLSDAEIERYTNREPAFDCAGAFKSETLGISLFDAIRSDDPTALVGLPLIAISKALRAAGFQIP